MSTFVKIKSLIKQLLPTGRAFRMPIGGDGDKLIEATSEGLARVHDDIQSTLNAILPDNSNFTEDDATAWEIRLGMIVNPLVDLEIRKSAIIRKMNHPGTIKARQSADYFQEQLHLAGFTGVFVHANNDYLSIEEILNEGEGYQLNDFQLGDSQLGDAYSIYSDCFEVIQLGDYELGAWQLNSYKWCDIIANHIDKELDSRFFIGNDKRTFVIGGELFGKFGDIPAGQVNEFRQLVLKLKPVESVALLLINYT
jgi:uncharacterized protein YmfQ (DUF2313 family)